MCSFKVQCTGNVVGEGGGGRGLGRTEGHEYALSLSPTALEPLGSRAPEKGAGREGGGRGVRRVRRRGEEGKGPSSHRGHSVQKRCHQSLNSGRLMRPHLHKKLKATRMDLRLFWYCFEKLSKLWVDLKGSGLPSVARVSHKHKSYWLVLIQMILFAGLCHAPSQ